MEQEEINKFMTEENEVKNRFVKFNVVGDYIVGKLKDVREVESNLADQAGKMQKIYDIEAEAGCYHDLDANKRPLNQSEIVTSGQTYCVGGKPMIDDQMRNCVIGQRVGFKFKEEKPNKKKGFNAIKVIKVYRLDPAKELQQRMEAVGV